MPFLVRPWDVMILLRGRLYFSGLFVLDRSPIAGFATVRPEHGPAEVRAGVRQLVTRVVTAVAR